MALALISDLAMQSQAAAAAARAGTTLAVALTADALIDKAQAMRPSLVILDLSHPGLDVAATLARLKPLLAEGGVTLAFGPHVHHERLEAARAAGCDRVVSRGEFHARMEEMFRDFGYK